MYMVERTGQRGCVCLSVTCTSLSCISRRHRVNMMAPPIVHLCVHHTASSAGGMIITCSDLRASAFTAARRFSTKKFNTRPVRGNVHERPRRHRPPCLFARVFSANPKKLLRNPSIRRSSVDFGAGTSWTTTRCITQTTRTSSGYAETVTRRKFQQTR